MRAGRQDVEVSTTIPLFELYMYIRTFQPLGFGLFQYDRNNDKCGKNNMVNNSRKDKIKGQYASRSSQTFWDEKNVSIFRY